MSKSRLNIDISQLDNLTIDNAENPRARRKLPRINGRALSKIVGDLDDDSSEPKNNLKQEGRENSSQASPGEPAPLRHSNSAAKKTKAKKKSGAHAKPNLEPLNPLTAAEHINVSCRFVLKPESSLTPYNIHVDSPIPSHFVWRVIAPAQECPICLNIAEVPRMLGCGHIMCIHCMVQHRQFSTSPNVCPICGETVNPNPIRSMPVTFLHADAQFLPKDGDEVIFTLMSRPVNSALALPVDVESPKGSRYKRFPPPDFAYWTRVSQSELNYAKEELSKELKYLIGASKKSVQEFGSDEGYNDGILEIKKYLQMLNAQYDQSSQHVASQPPSMPNGNSTNNNASLHAPKQSGKQAQKHTPPVANDETVYFYQTAFESSTVYTLDSLDVSILKHAYGDYTNFPGSLIAKVENIEHTIYDRLRDKRLKYLSHLPEQTPVAFIECDWTGLLEPSVLEKFASKLADRKRQKRRKQAQDLADRRKAQASIERQFQIEVAEALLPHNDVGDSDTAGIDTAQLPSLPRNPTAKAYKPEPKQWVDEARESEEILKHAYVPKRGRKEMIFRF